MRSLLATCQGPAGKLGNVLLAAWCALGQRWKNCSGTERATAVLFKKALGESFKRWDSAELECEALGQRLQAV